MVEIKEFDLIEYLGKQEFIDLFTTNWEEIESHLVQKMPEPNFAIYHELAKLGCLISIGLFSDGVIVGYLVATALNHPHYGAPYVQHDVLYIAKEHRKGSHALRMMSMAKQRAKSFNAIFIAWHAKPNSEFEKILQHKRANLEEHVYVESLANPDEEEWFADLNTEATKCP